MHVTSLFGDESVRVAQTRHDQFIYFHRIKLPPSTSYARFSASRDGLLCNFGYIHKGTLSITLCLRTLSRSSWLYRLAYHCSRESEKIPLSPWEVSGDGPVAMAPLEGTMRKESWKTGTIHAFNSSDW